MVFVDAGSSHSEMTIIDPSTMQSLLNPSINDYDGGKLA